MTDQLGIEMNSNFNINVYSRKKELFYCLFEFTRNLDEALVIKFLILMDMFYPSYQLWLCSSSSTDNTPVDWKGLVLYSSLIFNKNRSITFYLTPPFYLQRGSEIEIHRIKEGISVDFSWNNKKDCYVCIFNLFADLVTNTIYLVNDEGYYGEDQSLAAPKNRMVLSRCLKATEDLLGGEIVEYITDNHLTPDSVYKYGIKEDARHITEHMDIR
jgi:hypothetical protein